MYLREKKGRFPEDRFIQPEWFCIKEKLFAVIGKCGVLEVKEGIYMWEISNIAAQMRAEWKRGVLRSKHGNGSDILSFQPLMFSQHFCLPLLFHCIMPTCELFANVKISIAYKGEFCVYQVLRKSYQLTHSHLIHSPWAPLLTICSPFVQLRAYHEYCSSCQYQILIIDQVYISFLYSISLL